MQLFAGFLGAARLMLGPDAGDYIGVQIRPCAQGRMPINLTTSKGGQLGRCTAIFMDRSGVALSLVRFCFNLCGGVIASLL